MRQECERNVQTEILEERERNNTKQANMPREREREREREEKGGVETERES